MTSTKAIVIPNAQRKMCPAQVRDPSVAPLEAEKRLMLAVLERAVNDLRTYAIVPTGRGRGLFMEVEAWFDSSATGPFDFESICQATGLDPDFIRKGLRLVPHVAAAAPPETGARQAKIGALRPAAGDRVEGPSTGQSLPNGRRFDPRGGRAQHAGSRRRDRRSSALTASSSPG